MAHKVLIPQDISEEGKRFLRDRGYEIKIGSGITEDALCTDVGDCSAILARTARFPAKVLRAGSRLKVIGRHGVGFDNIDVAVATELGIQITYAPESNAGSVAEHTIGLIIAEIVAEAGFDDGDFIAGVRTCHDHAIDTVAPAANERCMRMVVNSA